MYTEYTAYQYACYANGYCERTGVIGVYGGVWECQRFACQLGNSTCGDQFGGSDPVTLACEACKRSCVDATGTQVCYDEMSPGYCNLTDGKYPYWASCSCQ